MGRMEPPAEGASLATQWAASALWGPGSGMRTGEWGQGELVEAGHSPGGQSLSGSGRKESFRARTEGLGRRDKAGC